MAAAHCREARAVPSLQIAAMGHAQDQAGELRIGIDLTSRAGAANQNERGKRKMNKTELKANVTATGSHFFDRDSMKFFGDTMKNYGVRSAQVETWTQGIVDCWELYRIHPVKHGLKTSAYFRKDNFEKVSKKEEIRAALAKADGN